MFEVILWSNCCCRCHCEKNDCYLWSSRVEQLSGLSNLCFEKTNSVCEKLYDTIFGRQSESILHKWLILITRTMIHPQMIDSSSQNKKDNISDTGDAVCSLVPGDGESASAASMFGELISDKKSASSFSMSDMPSLVAHSPGNSRRSQDLGEVGTSKLKNSCSHLNTETACFFF